MSPVLHRASNSSSASPRQSDIEIDSDTASRHAAVAAPVPTSASHSAVQILDTMWASIEQHRRNPARNPARDPAYFDNNVVTPNHTGVRCLNNEHTLTVRLRANDATRTPIHANYVPLSSSTQYAVGQSPEGEVEAACTSDLIQSLDSGQGLFQFTTRNAHGLDVTNARAAPTVARMLDAHMQKTPGAKINLSERYRVETLRQLESDPASADVTHYELTATDLQTNLQRTIHITQAGLRFVDKLLASKEIARAAELFKAHADLTARTSDAAPTDMPPQTGPLICSAAGIGRSAVLAVYQDICQRMPVDVNPSNLDAQLEAAIKQGISTRGPKFLHSKKQLAALRDALLVKMREAHRSPSERQARERNLSNQLRDQAAELQSETSSEHSGVSSPSFAGSDRSSPRVGLLDSPPAAVHPVSARGVTASLTATEQSDQGQREPRQVLRGSFVQTQRNADGDPEIPVSTLPNTVAPLSITPPGSVQGDAVPEDLSPLSLRLDADLAAVSQSVRTPDHTPMEVAGDGTSNLSSPELLGIRTLDESSSGVSVRPTTPQGSVLSDDVIDERQHSSPLPEGSVESASQPMRTPERARSDVPRDSTLSSPSSEASADRTPDASPSRVSVLPDTATPVPTTPLESVHNDDAVDEEQLSSPQPRGHASAALQSVRTPERASPAAGEDRAASPPSSEVSGDGSYDASSSDMSAVSASESGSPVSHRAASSDPAPAAVKSTAGLNPKRVTFGPDPAAQATRRSRPTSYQPHDPIALYIDYYVALQRADSRSLESIKFPADFILQEPATRRGGDPEPVVTAAALAIATVARYIRDSATSLKSASYRLVTDSQKTVYRDLLSRVDSLTPHRVFQSLLRPSVERPTRPTVSQNFFDKSRLAVYVPPEVNDDVSNCEEIRAAAAAPDGVLNGVPFVPWQNPPTTTQEWNDHAPAIAEPALADDCNAAAVVIVEKDGRAWVMAPTNQRDGKRITFPRGRLDNELGLSAQACALKQAYEKTGLQIRLTNQLVDIKSASGTTRYYRAERIGGTPADAGWKSQAVALVPMKKMAEVFADIGENTHARERYAVDALQQSTLYTRLNNYAPLRRSRELLKSWVYRLAPILPTNPRYLEEQNFVSSHYLNLLGFDLSNQLNRIIENWRKNNHPLLDDVPARPGSAPLRAATVLRTPAGSAVPYLHANAIPITDCPFQFIAAQRPQPPFVPAKKVSTALGLAQALPRMFGQNAPAEAVPQTDNSVTFWQTTLKEKVNVIVDLDDAKARPEATPYGPSLNTQKEIGSHTLVVTTEHRQRNLRIEEIQARDADNPTSNVSRLHFTGWPERNAIEPQALIDLARDVVLATQSYGPKVLVHSTRGSSRAGTLITFIAASEQVTSLLQGQRTMTPAALVDIVLKIIVRGRTERGPDFVDSAHIQLIFVALLKKHFVGVRGEPGAQDGELVAR